MGGGAQKSGAAAPPGVISVGGGARKSGAAAPPGAFSVGGGAQSQGQQHLQERFGGGLGF